MINKPVMTRHFSRQAGTYDEYARVQKEMAEKLLEMVGKEGFATSKPLKIMDIGCGTGFFTQKLCETFPQAQITAVDIAPGMIEVVRRKLTVKNLEFWCEDIEEAVIPHCYDLIVSNAAFQWFNFMGKTLGKLYQSLSPGGVLCFSTFGPLTFTELHQSHRKAQRETGRESPTGPGQSFYSLSDLLSLCKEWLSGEAPLVAGEELITREYFDAVKMFLASVKRIGANNSNGINWVNPSLTKRMIEIYERDFNDQGRIPATYHSLFVRLKRAAGKERDHGYE